MGARLRGGRGARRTHRSAGPDTPHRSVALCRSPTLPRTGGGRVRRGRGPPLDRRPPGVRQAPAREPRRDRPRDRGRRAGDRVVPRGRLAPRAVPQPARSRWIDLGQPEEAVWAACAANGASTSRRRAGRAWWSRRAAWTTWPRSSPSTRRRRRAVASPTAPRRPTAPSSRRSRRAARRGSSSRGARRNAGRDPHAHRLGPRVIEPYGGMTAAGAESRANYLLKWEAIRSSRERGHAIYDLWGLAHPGIEQFKSGFGGREVTYVGGFELVLRPLVRGRSRRSRRSGLRASAAVSAGASGAGRLPWSRDAFRSCPSRRPAGAGPSAHRADRRPAVPGEPLGAWRWRARAGRSR